MTESTEQLMLMPTENVRKVPEIKLDDFKLGKVIGSGSYGTVYQGVLGEGAVAVKKIPILDKGKSFDIEVLQLSRVDHNYIIEIFATAFDEEHKYIIMEYADSGTLDKFLHSLRWARQCDSKPIYTKLRALTWALQCAEGVAYLHTRKLLHRDLRPAKLLLTHNGKSLKISDFGTVAELKTKMTNDKGTHAYMAPEIFTGTKYNEDCDVYSFGILFWEILSRQKPFKKFEVACVIPYNVQKGERPPTFPNFPHWITELLESCWHEDPEEQPTMEDVVDIMRSQFPDPYSIKKDKFMMSKLRKVETESENVCGVPKLNRDDFKLGKVIGSGAYGITHQGIWGKRAVAVKKILKQESFDIEVKQLSRVKNSNIISLFATAVDEDYKYIIMEYADGGTLHTYLHCDFKPIYTEYQGLRWARQCAEGVAYLHTRKPTPLLHRDLKPENLLLTHNYSFLKICDFGTVAEQKSTMTGEIGTAAYMAPEVFTGTKYNEKCDVYSFGILFWEILSRQKPFKEFEKACAIPFNAQKGLRPTLENCPPRATELIKSCWHQDPDKRPTMKDVVSTMRKDLDRDRYFKEEDTIRNHFPSIIGLNWEQLELFEMIDMDFDNIEYTGKFSRKKVIIIRFPPYIAPNFLVWIQQYLQLKHENVISILGIVEWPQAAVLDCPDLLPLDKFLHGNVKLEYSRAHALSWAHQCAEGMIYLHKIKPKPFLRFALNPQNLYLTLGGLQLKIADLEFFRFKSRRNRMLAYESPEVNPTYISHSKVCKGFAPNEKSDVYSWAIVLWEMLTRKKPFKGSDIQQIIRKIMRGVHPAIEDGWPESVKELMQKCWKKEPKERPTMERIASQMATFDKDPLTPIVSAFDLRRIQNSLPMIPEEDFDEETRSKMSRLDYFEVIISMWKEQKVMLTRIKFERFWDYSCHPSLLHIRHQNIVSILAIATVQKFPILEYSENGPLDKFLHSVCKTEYTIDHALSWAQQLAEGCGYLLTKGFVVDKYSPSVLFLSNKCRTLKISTLTFGEFSGSRDSGFYVSAAYRPTVLISTEYNWAIVLWEILTRKKPFDGLSEEDIECDTSRGIRPLIGDDWPDSIRMLIHKCWHSCAFNRPHMQEVAREMKEIMVDFPRAHETIEYEFDGNFQISNPAEPNESDK